MKCSKFIIEVSNEFLFQFLSYRAKKFNLSFCSRLLAKSVTLTFRFSDYFVTFLHKVPFIVAAALIALCFSACGGLALCVGLVFYFLKVSEVNLQ